MTNPSSGGMRRLTSPFSWLAVPQQLILMLDQKTLWATTDATIASSYQRSRQVLVSMQGACFGGPFGFAVFPLSLIFLFRAGTGEGDPKDGKWIFAYVNSANAKSASGWRDSTGGSNPQVEARKTARSEESDTRSGVFLSGHRSSLFHRRRKLLHRTNQELRQRQSTEATP